MKNINSALILCFAFFSFITWTLGSFHGIPSNSLASLKRKPYVSPEEPAVLQSYKRIKRQANSGALQEFQQFLLNSKAACFQDMKIDPNQLEKSLLYEANPTPTEKCVMECVLKRTDIMDQENKLSAQSIGRIASIMSNNNPLVVSIATAAAENCNKFVDTRNSCEAAFKINQCLAHELKSRKMKLLY